MLYVVFGKSAIKGIENMSETWESRSTYEIVPTKLKKADHELLCHAIPH